MNSWVKLGAWIPSIFLNIFYYFHHIHSIIAKNRNTLNEPNLEYGNYSYADYLTWQREEVVKLIKGFALDLEEIFGDIE